MFFGLMSAVLVGVKYKSDKRDQYLHHGGWLVKLALWLGFCILPFFFPVGLVNAYCKYHCLLCVCMYFTSIVSEQAVATPDVCTLSAS